MRLYRQTVQDFGLCSGMELSEDTMNDLREASGRMSAKMRSVRIVSASGVSKNDLQRRLIQKGEDPVHAKEAVEWMSEMQLLDDRKTAEQIAHSCISKGYGVNHAKQALFEKRIPKEYWKEALEGYPDQTERIVSFFQTRLGEQWDDRQLRRAIEAAQRRGHLYSEIRAALEIIRADMDEFPEE